MNLHLLDQKETVVLKEYPFMYEPLTTISGSDTGESDSSEDSSPRLLNLNW